MAYDDCRNEDGYCWVVYSCGMGTGIEIDMIGPGEDWNEGYGEEEKGRFPSISAARAYIQNTFYR